jgi:hypothetical protein
LKTEKGVKVTTGKRNSSPCLAASGPPTLLYRAPFGR